MLRRLLFGFKGFSEAMAMQNPVKAKALMDRAAAGDAEAQRICIDCYCEMSHMIPQIAMQALHAASSGGNADADGLLAESLRRGEATGKPDPERAMVMDIRSVGRGSYVGAVNLAEEFARGSNVQRDCRKALEYIRIAEKRLTERVTTSEENSRKLVRFARKKIDHIKPFVIRKLGAEQPRSDDRAESAFYYPQSEDGNRATYYLHHAGETTGPYTFAQLRSMWDQGSLDANTLYCEEGYPEWLALRVLLEDQSKPRPPPLPDIAQLPIDSALMHYDKAAAIAAEFGDLIVELNDANRWNPSLSRKKPYSLPIERLGYTKYEIQMALAVVIAKLLVDVAQNPSSGAGGPLYAATWSGGDLVWFTREPAFAFGEQQKERGSLSYKANCVYVAWQQACREFLATTAGKRPEVYVAGDWPALEALRTYWRSVDQNLPGFLDQPELAAVRAT